jgi:RND family efflux transporter MFP subunit
MKSTALHNPLIGLATALAFVLAPGAPALAAGPATYAVGAGTQDGRYVATGTLQAVRQGTLGAQLAGRVLEVLVRSGDPVKAGQPLIRIDAQDALDAASASAASASGAAARLATARADYERAQRLHAQEYISVAALQRSEGALRSAEADAQASGAAANSAHVRAGWRTVTAPYAGIVTDVLVTAGDLATPGRPLLSLYDPAALRVVAQVPESLAGQLQASKPALLAAGEGQAPMQARSWAVVGAVDPATHSVEVRAELPPGTRLQPGAFAQLLLPVGTTDAQLRIPARTVLHRSEVTAVYVVDAAGAAHLRQVRLGPVEGDQVTVLAGLQAGEQVALDPVAAGSH